MGLRKVREVGRKGGWHGNFVGGEKLRDGTYWVSKILTISLERKKVSLSLFGKFAI